MEQGYYKQEKEISFSEIGWYIVLKWKLVLVWMIIGGVILGGYGIYKASTNIDKTYIVTMNDLTTEEQQEVLSVLKSYEEYQLEVDKQENDYLMNMNHNIAYRCLITYYVDTDYTYNYLEVHNDYTAELVSMYKTYVFSNTVLDKIQDLNIEGLDKQDLNYLVGATNEGAILKYTVLADNEEDCKKIAELISQEIESYYYATVEFVGEHKLVNVIEDVTCVYSETVRNAQQIKSSYINGLLSEIENEKNSLSQEQLIVYENKLLNSSEDIEINDGEDFKVLVDKKYIMIGAIAGALVALTYSVVKFLAGKKINSVSEIEQVYNIDVLGKIISDNTSGKKIVKKINKIQSQEGEMEQQRYVADLIIHRCKEKPIEDMVICSTVDGMDNKIEKIVSIINESKIKCSYIGNINNDICALNKAAECKNVILVEQLNSTNKNDFENEIKVCCKISAEIIGIIVMV